MPRWKISHDHLPPEVRKAVLDIQHSAAFSKPVLASQIGCGHTRFVLIQNANDLLFGESFSLQSGPP